jgi:hypothetical protein
MVRPLASAFRRVGTRSTREWRGLCDRRFGLIDFRFALLLLGPLLSICHYRSPIYILNFVDAVARAVLPCPLLNSFERVGEPIGWIW